MNNCVALIRWHTLMLVSKWGGMVTAQKKTVARSQGITFFCAYSREGMKKWIYKAAGNLPLDIRPKCCSR